MVTDRIHGLAMNQGRINDLVLVVLQLRLKTHLELGSFVVFYLTQMVDGIHHLGLRQGDVQGLFSVMQSSLRQSFDPKRS